MRAPESEVHTFYADRQVASGTTRFRVAQIDLSVDIRRNRRFAETEALVEAAVESYRATSGALTRVLTSLRRATFSRLLNNSGAFADEA